MLVILSVAAIVCGVISTLSTGFIGAAAPSWAGHVAVTASGLFAMVSGILSVIAGALALAEKRGEWVWLLHAAAAVVSAIGMVVAMFGASFSPGSVLCIAVYGVCAAYTRTRGYEIGASSESGAASAPTKMSANDAWLMESAQAMLAAHAAKKSAQASAAAPASGVPAAPSATAASTPPPMTVAPPAVTPIPIQPAPFSPAPQQIAAQPVAAQAPAAAQLTPQTAPAQPVAPSAPMTQAVPQQPTTPQVLPGTMPQIRFRQAPPMGGGRQVRQE